MKKIFALLLSAALLLPLAAGETDIYVMTGNVNESGWPEIAEDIVAAIESYGIGAETLSPEDEILNSRSTYSTGTGFFISPDTIVTNRHVIEDAPDDVLLQIDGKMTECRVAYIDEEEDLAILKTARRNGPYFRVLKSGEYKHAEPILVLGYPLTNVLGSEIRITNGIINALSGYNGDKDFVQISAPIQPGNSGGPVITDKFAVVGIATETLESTADNIHQNINFALKSDVIRRNASKYVPTSSRGNFVSNIDEAVDATVNVICGYRSVGQSVPYAIVYEWTDTEDEYGIYTEAYLYATDLTKEDLPIAAVTGFEGYTLASYSNTLDYLVGDLIDSIIEYQEQN